MPEPLEWDTKDPDEVIKYGIDFTNSLSAGDSLSSITYTFVAPAGLTKSGERIRPSTNIAEVVISGGTDGQVGRLTCQAITALGETLEEAVIVRVQAN
jgi:hypothetical protein